MSLFNAYSYQPLHIYEGQSGKLITTILIQAWPQSFCEAMPTSQVQKSSFCATKDLFFILGQSANTRLLALAKPLMDQTKSLYAQTGKPVRLFTSFYYQAKTWACARRIICKAEITTRGQNTRFVGPTLKVQGPPLSTKMSIVLADRWKTSLKITKPFSTQPHILSRFWSQSVPPLPPFGCLCLVAHLSAHRITRHNVDKRTGQYPPKSLP